MSKVFYLKRRYLSITGIGKGNDRAIDVIVKATGNRLWLPRHMVDFLPGHVVIPEYLYSRIFPKAISRKTS